MASALLNLSSSQSRRRNGEEEKKEEGKRKKKKERKNVKRKTYRPMKREEVVMRMAKSPRECARAAGWMREIEARG